MITKIIFMVMMAIIPFKVVNDKVARVNAILPIIEGGRVYIPEQSDWLDTFVDECVTFPGGNHDDQVDAMTMAVDVLSRTSVSPEAWNLHSDPTQSLNYKDIPSLGKSLKTRVSSAIPKWTGWGT